MTTPENLLEGRSISSNDMRRFRIRRPVFRRFAESGLRASALGLALTVGATTAAAAAFELPPLASAAATEHHVGKVVWVDLVTLDLDSAQSFYGGLFGWTFHDVVSAKKDYTVAYLDGRPVAGLVRRDVPPGEKRQPAWLTFIAVRDVGDAERIALAHGAKLLSEPHTYPRRGRQAVFADPQGAVFAVLASSAGDTPDVLAAPGEWIWSSLITSDPDTDAAFYQTMFGYEVYDLPSEGAAQHLILSTDDYARASANTLPADKPNRHPHWLNFVRVLNVADAAAKATSLGGRVLVEPHQDRQGSMIAILADPAGARFGVMQWSEEEGQEAAK
jgi:predicted enzyme related to lactoylglutathione lyase